MKLFLFLFVGLVMGPSFLEIGFPKFADPVASICANLFLLMAGLELSFKKMGRQLLPAAKLSVGAFLFPFLTGLIAAMIILRDTPLAGPESYIFIALALAVSALPVAIQILKDLKLYHTDLGRLIIATATLCDILAWVCFALILPAESLKSWFVTHLSLVFFFLGLALSDSPYPSERLREQLQRLNTWVFGPIFFISIGWKLNLWLNLDWSQVLLVFILASVSKWGGSYWTARQMGFSKQRSLLLGLTLNSRGAVEIIISNLALQQGLISEKIFATLVILAIATSLIPGPVTRLAKLRDE
ncbi:cation:proton antiporter [Bdellovibrio sp. HCB274]|uniref:cation:proton antiporter n=1 Tax=Bdellovibrio sp. HCB274 TaxID=3394361 RepID=UPI0039B3EF6E